MATPATQLDASEVRERVLEVLRSLLEELGSRGALPMLNGASRLDRDLGLGSLERVELLARLETAFGVRLPDRLVAEANTPEDLAKALQAAPGAETPEDETGSAFRAAITTQRLHGIAQSAAKDAGVFSTETLLDVL
ncbi:MAG: acyl carrier protein, partial [Candidatus Acidiferrum sp.]